MANGFSIAHHVFPGNTADKATLKKVLTDLQERFGLRHIMIVSDRGLVSDRGVSNESKLYDIRNGSWVRTTDGNF